MLPYKIKMIFGAVLLGLGIFTDSASGLAQHNFHKADPTMIQALDDASISKVDSGMAAVDTDSIGMAGAVDTVDSGVGSKVDSGVASSSFTALDDDGSKAASSSFTALNEEKKSNVIDITPVNKVDSDIDLTNVDAKMDLTNAITKMQSEGALVDVKDDGDKVGVGGMFCHGDFDCSISDSRIFCDR